MKKRKPHKSGKAGMERWLLTYADLITLLMIFFVVLYSLSSLNAKKFQAIAMSIAKAMGGGQSVMSEPGASFAPGVSGSALKESIDATKESKEMLDMQQIKKELQEAIDKNGMTSKVSVNMVERGVVVSFYEAALFPLGKAELTTEASDLIGKVGQIIIKVPQYLRIEGHTDNLPINTGQFPSNWELSEARANSVLKELINNWRFEPRRMSVTGYGEYRPRMSNDPEEGRRQNRRVDIVILKSKYESAEASTGEGAGQVISSGNW